MIKNFLSEDQPDSGSETKEPSAPASGSTLGLFDSGPDEPSAEPRITPPPEPESTAETFRRTGLAYSAGIAFSAAVIFMLVLGWGADVLLGTSPWGIVGGIIIGSAIGFIQFFRITSQIFKK